MNNKLTFTGGEPNMVEDDFLRIQQSNRLGLHGLAKALSNDPYIVSGCVVTDNVTNINITAGYIFFNGELIKVDAQNAVDTAGNGFYRYVVSTTFEAGGDKTYLDSQARQTWEKKRGVPTSVSVISGGDLDVINGNRNIAQAWQTPIYETGYGGFSTNPLRFRKLLNGQIQLNGNFDEPGTPGALNIFTLPVGYRPTIEQQIIVFERQGSTNVGHLNISTGGIVAVSQAVSSNVIVVNEILPLD